jgi:hypothetical protein
MVLAWEKRSPTVAVAMILGGDMVYKDMIRVAFGMLRLPNMLFYFETKKPDVALSRNIVTAQALRDKCEWVFFMDSDIVPPLTVLPDLLLHDLPIVTALYWRRYEGLEPCIYRLGKDGVPVPYTNEQLVGSGNVVEIEACGAGCLLVHSSVFEKLKGSVEQFDILDPATREMLKCWKFWEYIVHSRVNLSEDIVLASRVKGLGFRIFADLTLRCGHLSNVVVKEGVFKQTPLVVGREV